MSRGQLVLRYTGFAVLATLANLAAQRLVLTGGDGTGWFLAAMGVGTLVGLVVKYLLDKRWIFFDKTTGAAAKGRQFGLYSLMGVATTAIFWAFETTAWAIWGTDLAREIGAVLGLCIGYVTKYQLDRRFVFNRPPAHGAAP